MLKKSHKISGISVVVTTYNWPQALERVLQHLIHQSYVNYEILVADDGSKASTQEVILSYQKKTQIRIKHIWQEDKGFRAAKIRNLAVLQSQYDYLLFVDQDCLVGPHFLSRHARLAEIGFFVAGNRILLSESYTKRLLFESKLLQIKKWFWLQQRIKRNCNRFLPILYYPFHFGRRFNKRSWSGAKTCNLGMYKKDFEYVNGFDESYEGWGLEDTDLVIRLIRSGIYKKQGKFAVPVFHLHHKEQSRDQLIENQNRLKQLLDNHSFHARQGLAQYHRT